MTFVCNMRRCVQGCVAVALASQRSFAEHVAAFGRPTTGVVLIWHTRDLLNPETVLTAHHEVTAFDFHPHDPTLVAGGLGNGQVVLWELGADAQQASTVQTSAATALPPAGAATSTGTTGAPAAHAAAAAAAASASEAAGSATSQRAAKDDDQVDTMVAHKCASTLEASHRQPVAQLVWLPSWEVSSRGGLSTQGSGDDAFCMFFATCAADGKVHFWDCRGEQQRSKKRRNDGVLLQVVLFRRMSLLLHDLHSPFTCWLHHREHKQPARIKAITPSLPLMAPLLRRSVAILKSALPCRSNGARVAASVQRASAVAAGQ